MSTLYTDRATVEADEEHRELAWLDQPTPGELAWLDQPTPAEIAWLDTLRRRLVSPAKTNVESSRDSQASLAPFDVRVLKHR